MTLMGNRHMHIHSKCLDQDDNAPFTFIKHARVKQKSLMRPSSCKVTDNTNKKVARISQRIHLQLQCKYIADMTKRFS